jgi:hypothetical protein
MKNFFGVSWNARPVVIEAASVPVIDGVIEEAVLPCARMQCVG